MRIMNVVCLMCYYQAVTRHFEGNKRPMRSFAVCVTHLEKANSLLLIHRKFQLCIEAWEHHECCLSKVQTMVIQIKSSCYCYGKCC